MAINIIINGAHGKMGKVTQNAIKEQDDLNLIATTSRHDDLAETIQKTKADVVIDFTRPDCVFENAKIIIHNQAHPVIGTSGLTLEQIEALKSDCQQQMLGAIIAPNFSLGAILMMKYTRDAAKYIPNVEIIEMHHQHKVDAPSGTAKKTAEMIATAVDQDADKNNLTEKNNARGELYQGIPIHSVRLPGLFAHQTVIFGAPGETLTIRHDSMDRIAMMPGVILACRKVITLNHLVYGLENIL